MKGTIKSKQEIERLFKEGRRSSCRYCSLISAPSLSPGGRCAFIAGKKLGAAPLRSRCKRVMREAARELGAPWAGMDVVFIARKGVATAGHADVLRQMGRALEGHVLEQAKAPAREGGAREKRCRS